MDWIQVLKYISEDLSSPILLIFALILFLVYRPKIEKLLTGQRTLVDIQHFVIIELEVADIISTAQIIKIIYSDILREEE